MPVCRHRSLLERLPAGSAEPSQSVGDDYSVERAVTRQRSSPDPLGKADEGRESAGPLTPSGSQHPPTLA